MNTYDDPNAFLNVKKLLKVNYSKVAHYSILQMNILRIY